MTRPLPATTQQPLFCTTGLLALIHTRKRIALQVLHSAAGHNIGTSDRGRPASRESVEYFPTQSAALHALDSGAWTQRLTP
jgi:hypothetical protein